MTVHVWGFKFLRDNFLKLNWWFDVSKFSLNFDFATLWNAKVASQSFYNFVGFVISKYSFESDMDSNYKGKFRK